MTEKWVNLIWPPLDEREQKLMKEYEMFRSLIDDGSIPITFRNAFKNYLKWKSETGELK